jgi:DUF4097 and DUF4098 domain-containing protein YvlB
MLLAVGLLVAPGCIVDLDLDDEPKEYVSDPFSFVELADGVSVLNLKSINGVIEVFGDPSATEILIEGERRVGAETRRKAEDHLDDLDVDVSRDGSRLWIETDQPRFTRGREYTVDYTIYLPVDLEVFIEHTNGEIYAENLENYLSIDHTNGSIELREMTADLHIDLVNGSIVADTELRPDGTVEIETTNGDIDIAIPQTTSAELDAQVTNGRIFLTNLGVSADQNTKVLTTLGDGDGLIDLRTVNGTIRVTGVD